jgi:CRP-like cAMP-binding protein
LQESPLVRFVDRLMRRSRLSREEREAVLSLDCKLETHGARRDIVKIGQIVDHACLVIDGLVGRFDLMSNGQRQITAFHIPGDMCDLHSVVVPRAAWSINALSKSVIAKIPHTELRALAESHPALALAFWRDSVVDASILAKWVGNLGRKGAVARLAHLICELGVRLEYAELGSRTLFELSATQEQLADAAGMTSVHVSRMMQELKAKKLVKLWGGSVEVLDWEGLSALAEFDPAYLLTSAAA